MILMVKCPGDELIEVLFYLDERVRESYGHKPGSVDEILRENPDLTREDAELFHLFDIQDYVENPRREEFIWQYGRNPDDIRTSLRQHIDEGCKGCFSGYFQYLARFAYTAVRIGLTKSMLEYAKKDDKELLGLMK